MADKFIGDHGLTKTHVADEALLANRFVKLVTATGTPAHVVYADAGELAVGVTRQAYASGELVDVIYEGTAYVTASENLTAGTACAAAADGGAAPAASTNQVLGIILTDTNSGDPALIKLSYGGVF